MIIADILSNIGQLFLYDKSAPLIFSSGVFWLLFILFMPVYAAVKNRRWQMLLFVVAFSLYFYYKSSGIFFLLLIGTSLLDWSLSKVMVKLESKNARKLCVTISIVASLSILCYFKYANFFLSNLSVIVSHNFQPLDIILPVGISFYTFQSISYIVDVYKGRVAPTNTWLEYLFFLSFFPALVAGPIVRADYFLPQIKENHIPKRKEIYTGLWLIILGVIKKAIIADYIAQYNDLIFNSPGTYSGFETLMGVVGYTMQIYCDFSGYSDMAIGIALIMGFKLCANFDFPYKSKNLTEFWRRWYISLSSWLRDYVYIPLGGNRKGTLRTYINNFLTMLIGGLWHGANWKFVFWGAMHGAGLAVHKACRPFLDKLPSTFPVKAISWTITMTFVSMLWVFFRADSWTSSWQIISKIFTDFSISYFIPFVQVHTAWCIMMSVIIIAHALPRSFYAKMEKLFVNLRWWVKFLIFMIVVQLVIQFMSADVAPFIYFDF